MTFVRIHRAVFLVGLSLGALATYACSLNPQPLPPGETLDGGDTNAGQGGHDAAGGFAGNDAGDAQGGGEPEGGTVPPDAQSPLDAGDAASDSPPDATADAEDGSADSPSGEEEGG